MRIKKRQIGWGGCTRLMGWVRSEDRERVNWLREIAMY